MTKKLLQEKFEFLLKKAHELKVKDLPAHPEVRGTLFALEGILRLHLRGEAFNSKGVQVVTKALVRLKDLEDALGAYSYSVEIKDYMAAKTQQQPEILTLNFKKAKKQFKREYKHRLKDIAGSYQELMKLNWPKAEEVIPKFLNIEIKRILDKNKNKLKPLILKKQYSDFEIQEGLHEWRRMIRWVSIYFQAYKELFYLAPSQSKNKEDLKLIKKYVKDPFCLLGPKTAPLKISSLAFYQLSDFIKRVGDLKSEAEMVRTLTHEFGLVVPNSFTEKQAHEVYQEYEKSDVLKKLLIKEQKNAVPKKAR